MAIKTITTIFVQCQFEGIHVWPNAPDGSVLKDRHRHIFHVKLWKMVQHHDRHIEFIQFKRDVQRYCEREFGIGQGDALNYTKHSCEAMAHLLFKQFEAEAVEVSEDGENGAVVTRSRGSWDDQPPKPTKRDNLFTVGPSPVAKELLDKGQHLHLPSMQIKTKCFIGTEAEGPHRGTRVMFVPGCVSPKELKKAWINRPTSAPFTGPDLNIQRIYLGAGNLPYPRNDTILEAVRLIGANHVDVEVDSYGRVAETAHRCCYTVISRDPTEQANVDFVKQIGTNAVTWVRNGLPTEPGEHEIYRTMLDDPLYSQDVDLNY